jgi:hypothetical protein
MVWTARLGCCFEKHKNYSSLLVLKLLALMFKSVAQSKIAVPLMQMDMLHLFPQVLNGLKHACSILVTSVPKETKASFSLQDPCEVHTHHVFWSPVDFPILDG